MSTVVAFHAHPDDEVLLTGGTLARLSAEGHRVVLVVATDGLLDAVPASGAPRLAEVRASAAILGVARVDHLGYADSGHGALLYADPPDRPRFMRADPAVAAARLAAILREENAELLLSYDAGGGYGHRDHVRVHEVGALAAELASTPRVLEATVPRDVLVRVAAVLRRLPVSHRYDLEAVHRFGSPRSAITHRVDVRRYAAEKQRALAAHRTSVFGNGRSASAFRLAIRLPTRLFGMIAGREWFAEAGATRPKEVYNDIFTSAL